MCPAAAFAMRNYANEMVYASTPAIRAIERDRLNASSHSLRAWHERLLFASSTYDFEPGAVQSTSQTAVPTFRATSVVKQVKWCLLSVSSAWADTHCNSCGGKWVSSLKFCKAFRFKYLDLSLST